MEDGKTYYENGLDDGLALSQLEIIHLKTQIEKMKSYCKMKLFKVTLSPYDFDQYDGAVIIAESKEQVLELIKNNTWAKSDPVTDYYFVNHNQNIKIIEIDINKIKEPTLLLSSFNAG